MSLDKPLFEVIWDRRRVVGWVTAVALAGGLAYTFFAPPIWEAKATLMFPLRNSSLSMLSGLMEGAGLTGSIMGGPTPLRVFGGVLKSERTLEYVCNETQLGRRDVMSMRDLTDQANENSITIAARDQDPELAKRVVSLHIAALNDINSDLSSPLFADDSKVLEQRIQEQQTEIKITENKLLAFQNQALTAPNVAPAGNGKDTTVVAAPSRWGEQQRALEIELGRVSSTLGAAQRSARKAARFKGALPADLPPVVKWRERLTDLQYELKVKQLSFGPESTEIKRLNESIGVTRKQMESEISRYMAALDVNGSNSENSIPALMAQKVGLEAQVRATSKLAKLAPAESIRLSRLMRDLASRSAILQQLQAQYEVAKVQAARNPNKWEVLDQPWVDEKPVNKGIVRNSAISIFAGLFLGSCLASIRRKKGPTSEAKPEDSSLPLAA